MDAFSSPVRLMPPHTPRRVPSPVLSPNGRRIRHEDGRLRDLSPETTLRAFTHDPMPFDTTRDEYKIFACIDTLTVAERDLGARVAKAAQRLKAWCAEIEQWGWSGSFEQPSADEREQKRKSIELRIRQHVADPDFADVVPPLEYWGSLLSDEVQQYEARLDDIEDEMLKLDVEELKEHVLDMHPTGRSRPSSAGFQAVRQHYKVMDDFSFLITQTLLSALPHHAKLKERLSTWTARVSILRQSPRYVRDLEIAQKAMSLGWEAIEPPTDSSDFAFEQWKQAVDTISATLHQRVSDLGRRLDRMLDTLEGREDCLPDHWIDTFEATEADYGRWKHESRRRLIDLEVRRRAESSAAPKTPGHERHSSVDSASSATPVQNCAGKDVRAEADSDSRANRRSITVFKSDPLNTPTDSAESIDAILSPKIRSTTARQSTISLSGQEHDAATRHDTSAEDDSLRVSGSSSSTIGTVNLPEEEALPTEASNASGGTSVPVTNVLPDKVSFESEPSPSEDESEFDEGDTVVHHVIDEPNAVQSKSETSVPDEPGADSLPESHTHGRPKPITLPGDLAVTDDGSQDSAVVDPPQTPRSWRGSLGSFSTDMSPDSSPHSTVEESPSVLHTAHRAMRGPRPELNAAMSKRRPEINPLTHEQDSVSAPWPPSRFASKPSSSAEELDQKISDILTTIPAHIRLRSGPHPDAPEVKPARGLMAKGSRHLLRAARSVSNFKAPELTLSPAKAEFELNPSCGRRAAAAKGDNDIKLYHLTQPGKEHPIKLFIRRVGENGERVMVRVGGGWSDLGEYLRSYAEHHGRRTASEGKFEVLGLEVKNQENSPTRPESRRERRISGGGYPFPSPSTTPVKPSGLGVGISMNKTPPPMPNFRVSTPDATEGPVPSSTTPSGSPWQGREVGLAGPNTKKLELSGEKLQWIEGMMKQVRTVSTNAITVDRPPFQRDDRPATSSGSRPVSRPGSRTGPGGTLGGQKTQFADLGKVGGTRRVFMKGGGKSNFGGGGSSE